MKKDREHYTLASKLLTAGFAVLCLVWVIPILEVLINSFKSNAAVNTDAFALPNAETFTGFDNYVKGMTFGNYPFLKSVGYSLFITVASVFLILLFTSMTAWYIVRVGSRFARLFYYLCLFSMIVPFQMVMFTLTFTADQLKLNTPYTIPVIYLGFGAGMAIFMFTGFIKGLPLEIEEAAAIDGCGPVRTYFTVVLPMLKPTQGQLRLGRFGRHDGGHHAEHHPRHHRLCLLPEAHHQRRRRRCGKRLIPGSSKPPASQDAGGALQYG